MFPYQKQFLVTNLCWQKLFFLSFWNFPFFFFPFSVGQLSPMLQAASCRLRLTGWEIGVARFFSSRKCGSETTLDCQGTWGPGRIQGKSDWQVPIIPFRVPRLKTLQPASHFSSWCDRLIWLSAGILHTAPLTSHPPWFYGFHWFKKNKTHSKKKKTKPRNSDNRKLMRNNDIISLESSKCWGHIF